jgi:hypothetical protein
VTANRRVTDAGGIEVKVTWPSKKAIAGFAVFVSLCTGGVITVPQWFNRPATKAQTIEVNEASHKALQEQIDGMNNRFNDRFDELEKLIKLSRCQ